MKLSKVDKRFLRWLDTFCAPMGTEIGKVSPTVNKLVRCGFITRDGMLVCLADKGVQALHDEASRRGV